MAATVTDRRPRPTWSRASLGRALARRPRLVTGALVAILTAATWPLTSLQAGVGPDKSWQLGVNLAATHHMQFGTDIDYTYGPLGYLTWPVLGTLWPAALGVVFLLVVQAALVATLLNWTRPLLGTATSVAATFAIATFTNAPVAEVIPVLVLGWCVSVVCATRVSWLGRWLLPGLAGFAGFQLVVKFNIGLTSIGVVLLCAWFFPPGRWRSLGLAAAGVVVGFVLGWLVALQDPRHIPSFLSTSWEITSGYSSAMNLDYPPAQWQYIPALALSAAILWMVWTETRTIVIARRAILVVATAFCLYATFKHNFVRAYSMTDIVLACAILAFVPTTRTKRLGLTCGIGFGAILSLVAIAGGGVHQYNPLANAARPFTNVLNLVDHSRRTEVRNRGVANVVGVLGVDPSLLQRVGDATVAIDPYEISVAWAYHLNWRPVPIFQPFTAYTTSLDKIEADDLASGSAPRFILRRADTPGLDNRLRTLDSPDYFLAMLCRYRQVAVVGAWALLEHAPNRCGPPVELTSAAMSAGAGVAVPSGGDTSIVYAKLSFSPSLWARLREFVFKPENLPLLNVKRAGDFATYRYVVGTAQSTNVLWVPTSAGFSPGQLGGDLQAVAISMVHVPSYHVTFYQVPLAG